MWRDLMIDPRAWLVVATVMFSISIVIATKEERVKKMFNYESLGVIDLYKGRYPHDELDSKAIDRIREAWQDREVITFHKANGTPVYIAGAESKKENGELFVEITDDGFPDEIIGGIYDLTDYMRDHMADWFEVLEVK